MALTVGELHAVLKVDDRTVEPALRRVENAMRSTGRQIGDDAERAGQEAGEQLGQGLVRGADGQWRNLQGGLVDAVTAAAAEAESAARQGGRRVGDAVTAGLAGMDGDARQAGQQAGNELGNGLADGADRGVDQAGSKLERLKAVAGGAGMAAGAAAGALLVSAMSEALDQSRITAKATAGLGATPAQAKRYGQAAGQLYKNAVVTNFQEGTDAIHAIAKAGLVPTDATEAQLTRIGTKVADLSNMYGEETSEITRAAKKMLVTGMAGSATEAFDLIAKGFETSANEGDDFLDTINEYSVQLKRMGLSGKTAIGMISQGISAGARDGDQVTDALGQFGERATAGGKAVEEAFASIGLSADDVKSKLQKGGKSGQQALQMTMDALRGTTDKQTQLNAAAALFGDPANVMGDALFALDPATAAASTGMDKAAGSVDKLGGELRNNLGSKIDQFRNTAQQNLIDFLNGPLYGALGRAKTALGGIWDDAGKGGAQGTERIVAFVPLLGQKLLEKLKELAPKMIEGLMGAGQAVAEWVMANPMQVLKIAAIAGAILMALVALPALVAAGISATAITLMAGFAWELVKAAGSGLGSLGTSIGNWFSGLWSKYISGPVSRTGNSFITWVRGLPGRASSALSGLSASITARASAAWSSFLNTSVQRALAMVAWVKGLPSRISAGIGSLSGLLTQKGRNVVQGLWTGIQGMGGWIRDKIIGWARDVIPGPIAKALGISSPSKVTKAQGRWIARGLADGLTGSSKQVRAASYKLVDIVRDSLTGKRRTAALKRINKDAGWLDWLAQRETKVAGKLKTATKKMEDLRKARSSLAADVKKGVLSEADITKQDTGGWGQSAETILAGLRQDTAAAVTFAKHLATLKKKGVRSDLITQIAQAGVTGGASSAAALANANSSQIKQINAQQKALVGAAGQAGTTAGSAMYQAGIAAAQGLVKGLQREQKTIEATMLRMAKGLTKAMRQALGIKSPSRVMALIGAQTAQGLVKGVEGQRSAVNSTMASLVDTPAPGTWDSGYAAGAAHGGRRGQQRVVLEFRSSGRAEDDYMVSRLQRSIRIKAGGDVQRVLGQSGRRTGT